MSSMRHNAEMSGLTAKTDGAPVHDDGHYGQHIIMHDTPERPRTPDSGDEPRLARIHLRRGSSRPYTPLRERRSERQSGEWHWGYNLGVSPIYP